MRCSVVPKFLPSYSWVSFYGHSKVDHTVALDACLTRTRCRKFCVTPVCSGFNMNIVHLEMVNILLTVRVFAKSWSGKHVLMKWHNQAFVSILTSGCDREPYLGTCARNVWYEAALRDIDLQYIYVVGQHNHSADLLSCWSNSNTNVRELSQLVGTPI